MTDQSLHEFVGDLRRRLEHKVEVEPDLMMRDAFVSLVADYLVDDGTLDDVELCYLHRPWRKRKIEVAGYDISDDETILHLVVAEYGMYGATVKRDRIDQMVRRASAFADFCREGAHDQLEPSSQGHDMAQRIHAAWSTLRSVKLVVLTDGTANIRKMKEQAVGDLPMSVQVWDLARLSRLIGTTSTQEDVEIDLRGLGHEVRCLESPPQSDGYRCLMAVLPGKLLAELYEEHHSRLLQRNVRAYLQARGKINKKIAETIRTEPGRFLAYNNGVSATAKAVKLDRGPDGATLVGITELQIVNGGQTTASLHHAFRRGIPLDDVHVPAKITIIDRDDLDPMIPFISKYANSQNAVTSADFEGNGVWHVSLEKVSRSVWSTDAESGGQSRWYYERVRGQYDVERARHPAGAKRRTFDAENPRGQRITKTDVAKLEYTFGLSPHVVSTGAQKCFLTWTAQEDPDKRWPPTVDYFKHLVARAILLRGTYSMIQKQFVGYMAQLSTYTVAVLADRLDRLDLDLVWRAQAMPPAIAAVVPELAQEVREVLVPTTGSANVTEWCKKAECWDAVREVGWRPSAALVDEVSTR